MQTSLLQGIIAIMMIALAGIGWAGYWNEFQQRIKLEQKVKKMYGE